MRYAYLLVLCFILAVHACKRNAEPKKAIPQYPFFGVIPTSEPQLLAPQLLASPADEYNGTFSPDGQAFYYTTDVPERAFITYTEMMPDNTWSTPKVAAFSGTYSDFDPLFSPDGSRLYFSSSRPQSGQNSKIWYVERQDDGWGAPQAVPLTGAENNEYYSSITRAGHIYFNIWSTGDLYKATKTDSTYVVEALQDIINAGPDKGDPFISPDEDYLIFRGYGDDSYGRGDLYISFRIDGRWTAPENLGEPINSAGHEMCPYVTTDGRLFIFSSSRLVDSTKDYAGSAIQGVNDKFRTYDNGLGNIYCMSAAFIDDLREQREAIREE